jgi:HPt (histidine-containing phosphotransfer) domain-containing protein
MTAGAMQGDRDKCIAAGMDDYVSKPIRVAELKSVLVRLGMARNRTAKGADEVGIAPSPSFKQSAQSAVAVDLSWMLKLREMQGEDEPDIISNLLQLFIAETPNRMNALRRAMTRMDAEGVIAEAHSLNGSCASIGAQRMSSLCAGLERMAHYQLKVEDCSTLTRRIEEEFARVRKELEPLIYVQLSDVMQTT